MKAYRVVLALVLFSGLSAFGDDHGLLSHLKERSPAHHAFAVLLESLTSAQYELLDSSSFADREMRRARSVQSVEAARGLSARDSRSFVFVLRSPDKRIVTLRIPEEVELASKAAIEFQP